MRNASGAVLHRYPPRGEMVHLGHNRPPSHRQRRSPSVDLDSLFSPFALNTSEIDTPCLSCANVLYSASGFLVLRDIAGLHNLGFMENNAFRSP